MLIRFLKVQIIYIFLLPPPASTRGSNAAPDLPETDKDGNPRIVGGTVDMGSYEYNPAAPTANAGPDQTVNAGQTVTLDGSGSYDPDSKTLTYLWKQTGGIPVTLSDVSAVQPTFVVPEEGSGGVPLSFQLMVTNTDGLNNSDNVVIRTGYTLSVIKTGTGSGTVTSDPAGIECGADCGNDYPADTPLTLTATPDANSNFSVWSGDWSGDCTGTDTTVGVTMDVNKTCTANFAIKTFTVQVSSTSYGKTNMDGVTTVNYGDSLAIIATPEETLLFYRMERGCFRNL